MQLNLGAGSTRNSGWMNLDLFPNEGIDFVADLDNCSNTSLPIPDDSCTLMRLEHTLEHILKPLPLFNELYRIAAPNCKIWITCPFGHSEDAWADPTHVRPIIHRFFTYLAQPKYHSFDYGYTGDWQARYFIYKLRHKSLKEKVESSIDLKNPQSIHDFFKLNSNIVSEICCLAECIKPARPRQKNMMIMPAVLIQENNFNYEHGFQLETPTSSYSNGEKKQNREISSVIAIPETNCIAESETYRHLNKKYLNPKSKRDTLVQEDCLILDENLALVTSNGKYLPGGYSYARSWANHSRITKSKESKGFTLIPNKEEIYLPGKTLMLGVSKHYGHMYTDLFDRIISLDSNRYDHYITDAHLDQEKLEIVSALLGIKKSYLEQRVVYPPRGGAIKAAKLVCPSILGNKRYVSKVLVDSLRKLSKIVTSKIETNNPDQINHDKFYITRKGATRRKLHLEANAIQTLQKEGFIEYIPENNSLFSQMYTFSKAEIVALPAGSECYNLIYCSSNTKVFIFISKEYLAADGDFVDHIRSLAAHANLDLSFVECVSNINPKTDMHNQDIYYQGNLRFFEL